MSSPPGQFFRKTGCDPSAEPASNEDLECGHGSWALQTPTAVGYPSSPRAVNLPETQNIHASTVPQTRTPSPEYFSHAQYNDRHGSAAQMPHTSNGSSEVIGDLPQTIYSGSSPFLGPTRLRMPFQPPQNTSNRDLLNDNGPQHRSTSISSIASHEPPSPESPFDPGKHAQALQRLETHGSFKTIPSGEQEGDALNRTSVTWSEMGRVVFGEDFAPRLQCSLLQQPKSRASADPYATADQQSDADLASSPIQCLPNTVYQPVVLNQEDTLNIANMLDKPTSEGGQILSENSPSFVFPLPNTGANSTSQAAQQALHRSQVLLKHRPTISSKSFPGELIAADTSIEFSSNNPSLEGILEKDTTGDIVRKSGTQGSERLVDLTALEAEGEEDQQGHFGNRNSKRGHLAHTFDGSPHFEEIDEYLWSPAPSDDGQEAPPALYTPVPRHAPSDLLRASPISGFTSDAQGVFSRSPNSYGNGYFHSRYGSSGDPRVTDVTDVTDSPLPHIDVPIPGGNINLDSHSDFLSSSQHPSTKGSRESPEILFRCSGVLTHGASRLMSEIELKEEIPLSLRDRAKLGLSKVTSGDSSSQADGHTNSEPFCGEREPNARPDGFPLYQVQKFSADAGPGSSQTSSSLSTDHYGGGPSSYLARFVTRGPPSSGRRCPTPPLLFGSNAIGEPAKPNTTLGPALGSAVSRFDKNTKAIRLENAGRLPTLGSLGEQDWESVSAENEANTHAFDGIPFHPKTGSSLADYSDSGNLSLSKETPYCFHGVEVRPVMQHPAHPRHNHSFMLLKSSQTGDLVQVPQYEYALGGRLPNNNTSAQLVSRVRAASTYQHPSPLRVEHNHPFTSSPPIIGFTKPTAVSIKDSPVLMQQDCRYSELSNSGLSEGVQKVKEKRSQNPLYTTVVNTSRVCETTVDQHHSEMDSKEQSHQSSAWLSTLSQVASSEPSLPGHVKTFTKAIVSDRTVYVNDSSERGGNQEVGSNLADASCRVAKISSSPAQFFVSPTHFSDTSPSPGQLSNKHATQHDLDYGSHLLLGNFHKSLERPFIRENSTTSSVSTKDRSKSHSVSGTRMEQREPSRRRRSSSESHSRLMDRPSAKNTSALYVSSLDAHTPQATSSGLLLRSPFLRSDDDGSHDKLNRHDVIEQRGRQPKAEDASIDDSTTSSSTESRPFVRDGVVHTDVAPPIFYHPVYGRDRPWDRLGPGQPRPRPRPDPLGRRLLQRPVARAGSPHLHRISHPPTPELLERHVLVSRIYLIPSMVIPPIALIYGHGYMDGVMRFHTEGVFDGFRSKEKALALFWGYGLSAVCILAVVIVMIIVSASG